VTQARPFGDQNMPSITAFESSWHPLRDEVTHVTKGHPIWYHCLFSLFSSSFLSTPLLSRMPLSNFKSTLKFVIFLDLVLVILITIYFILDNL
jgi:hypothetical protein